jgi:hypothetical protein
MMAGAGAAVNVRVTDAAVGTVPVVAVVDAAMTARAADVAHVLAERFCQMNPVV